MRDGQPGVRKADRRRPSAIPLALPDRPFCAAQHHALSSVRLLAAQRRTATFLIKHLLGPCLVIFFLPPSWTFAILASWSLGCGAPARIAFLLIDNAPDTADADADLCRLGYNLCSPTTLKYYHRRHYTSRPQGAPPLELPLHLDPASSSQHQRPIRQPVCSQPVARGHTISYSCRPKND